MVFGAQTHTPKMCKQMDVFVFSQEAQFFLKARCARLEPWHLLPRRRKHMPAAVHVKAVADSALRCAGLSLCCVCGSSAASTSAVQLEYQQEQEQRKRSMEHRQEISSSTALVAVQAATHSVEFCLSPRFFPKEMAIFTPPLAKFSPAARIIDPPHPAGRRCAARIGYPNRHHHPCMVQHGRRRPGRQSEHGQDRMCTCVDSASSAGAPANH